MTTPAHYSFPTEDAIRTLRFYCSRLSPQIGETIVISLSEYDYMGYPEVTPRGLVRGAGMIPPVWSWLRQFAVETPRKPGDPPRRYGPYKPVIRKLP